MRYTRYMRWLLLFIFFLYGNVMYAQNYLNDGDFELWKSAFAPSTPCGSLSNTCGTVEGETYYATCPGGIASVNEKMLYWINRGAVSCSDGYWCAPHEPDWIYYSLGNGSNYQGEQHAVFY